MSSLRDRLHRIRRTVRRVVLVRRRLLAALAAGGAVAAGVHAVAAPPPPTVPVTVAVRDLPAGTELSVSDLTTGEFAPDAVPDGAARTTVGRTLAAPVRAGEPITDVRLVGPDLVAAHPELTTMPVRLPDPGAAALLEVGDRIDLLATDPQAGSTRVVTTGALVLATPPAVGPEPTGALPGTVVVLGVPPATATAVADAGVRWFLSFAFAR